MREDIRFLLWAGEKFLAGDPLTEEERTLFQETHMRQKIRAKNMLRLDPDDYRYEKGQTFK